MKRTRAEREHVLQKFRQRVEAGHTEALLDAIAYCGRHGVAQPDWVVKAFRQRWDKYRSFQVTTLDEAFGLPRRTWINKRRKEYLHKLDVYIAVNDLAGRHNLPIDDELFARVARDLGISMHDVKTLYPIARDEADAWWNQP